MGEAMSEGMVFTHAKARALLEVVRLAFEGGIAFGPTEGGCLAAVDDGDVSATSPVRPKLKTSRDHMEQRVPLPQRPSSTGSSSRLVPGGPCMWCAVTVTPQWRRPRGTNKLLCNACGIFFTRYGRLPEKSQHIHANSVQAASPATPPAESTPEPGSAGDQDHCGDAPLQYPGTQGSANPSSQHHNHHAYHLPNQQRLPRHAAEQALQQQHPHHQQQQQLTASSSSWLTGASPTHKRKDAPQPEGDLLRCLEDCAGSTQAEGAPSPALTPHNSMTQPVVLAATQSQPQQPQTQQGLAEAAPGAPANAGEGAPAASTPIPTAATAPGTMALGSRAGGVRAPGPSAAGALAAPSLLTVAPLDLGSLQHLSMQQLGLLGPPLGYLAALPPLGLNGTTAGPGGGLPPGPPGSSSGSNLGVGLVAPGAGPVAGPVVPQQAALSGTAGLAMLPYSLPPPPIHPGLVTATGVAGLDVTSGARGGHVYARPSKRQERLPAGESEDSNVSTDSHAATHVDAGTSHDEDEGGTTTATNSATASTVAAFGGLSCSPPSLPGLHFPPALFARPQGLPQLLPSAPPAASSPMAAAGHLPSAGFFAPQLGGLMVGDGDLQLQQVQQQPVILLHTRRSKGPRSRVSSNTPSSSTQS